MRVTGRWMAIAWLGLGLAAGCNQSASTSVPQSAGAVAVIDLDAIASRLGSDKQIVDSIAQRQTSLSQQLVDLAKSYNSRSKTRRRRSPKRRLNRPT